MPSSVTPTLVIGLRDTGLAVLEQFRLGLSPTLQGLPAISGVHGFSRDGEFHIGENSSPDDDSRALRLLIKQLLDNQVDSVSLAKAQATGLSLDATRLYVYVALGTDCGVSRDLEVTCRTLAEVADIAGIQQIHTALVLVIDDVMKLSEEDEEELRRLMNLLECLASPGALTGQSLTSIIPPYHCGWLIQHRNTADLVVRDKQELVRMVGLSLASLAATDLGAVFHGWHGPKTQGNTGSVSLGSFGAAFVRFPYEHLVNHLYGEVMFAFCRTFEEAVSPAEAQVHQLAENILESTGLTLRQLAATLRGFSNCDALVGHLREIRRQRREEWASALDQLETGSLNISFDSKEGTRFLDEVSRQTVDRLRYQMSAQMTEPSGVLRAATLARETAAVAEQWVKSGSERLAYEEVIRQRQEDLEKTFDERKLALDEKTKDLTAVEEHYFVGHALAHAFSLLAALVGYVFLPWVLFRTARSFPIGETMSAGHWVYVYAVLAIALLAAPLLNVYMRRLAERQLGLRLVGQSSLAMMTVVLPAVLAVLYLLMLSQGIEKGDVRLGLWILGPVIVVLLLTFPDIVRGIWERVVNVAKWCERHILRPAVSVLWWCMACAIWLLGEIVLEPINVVLRALRKEPIPWERPKGRKPVRGEAEVSPDTRRPRTRTELRPDSDAQHAARIERILRSVEPVQRVVQLTALSFAVIPFFGLLVAGIMELVDRAPSPTSASLVLSRLEVGAFYLPDLSMLSLLLLLALVVLPMDFIGWLLNIKRHQSAVHLEFGDAQRELAALIDVRAERQAAQLTPDAFEWLSKQARQLSKSADEAHHDFLTKLQQERNEAVHKSEEERQRIVDDTGLRPAFSIIRNEDDLVRLYGERLGNPYPASRDARAKELAEAVSKTVFSSWEARGAGEEAAREAIRMVLHNVRATLSPDLAADFFRTNDLLVTSTLASYRGPRWKYAVASLSDSDPRTADFVVAPCDQEVMRDWLPQAECITEQQPSAEVVAMKAVYGLSLQALPEWPYLFRRAQSPTGG